MSECESRRGSFKIAFNGQTYIGQSVGFSTGPETHLLVRFNQGNEVYKTVKVIAGDDYEGHFDPMEMDSAPKDVETDLSSCVVKPYQCWM